MANDTRLQLDDYRPDKYTKRKGVIMRSTNEIIHNGKTLTEWLEYNMTDDADLSRADLRRAYLRGADLRRADLSRADLRGADLRRAYLRGADLRRADLSRAYLRGADLRGAYLSGADLRGAKNIPPYVDAVTRIIPDGDIIGWKKCRNDVIVKVLIDADVPRSNATGRKCRSKSVKVLEVIGADEGVSNCDSTTIYRIGEIVECNEWNPDRWVECGGGIHWFITHQEAEEC